MHRSPEAIGQWFTPEHVADLALQLVLKNASSDVRVLDPSCGDGAFLRRAHARGVPQEQLVGVDVDEHAIVAARRCVPRTKLVHADLFERPELPPCDILVGNPPYVRQERLEPGAKERMLSSLRLDWPSMDEAALRRLLGRGDLAAPFLLRALGFLRDDGRAAFVISSAFFDSGYGDQFWSLLAQVATLELVVSAPKERWFADAAVNTVIAVFRRGVHPVSPQFCRLRLSTQDAVQALGHKATLSDIGEVREAKQEEPRDWAVALRAPPIWLKVRRCASFISLGQVATVRRGMTTGANDIFYLSRRRAAELALPTEFLRPVVTAPGKSTCSSIQVSEEGCAKVALVVPRTVDLVKYPALARYLASFPKAKERRTLAARQPWWSLSPRPAQVFLTKAYGERFVQAYSNQALVADQRVYCVYPAKEVDPVILAAVLNSMPTSLAIEALGRASMGAGALEWTVFDAMNLPILDPRSLHDVTEVRTVFEQLALRPVGIIAKECAEPDRRRLDEAICANTPLFDLLDTMAEELVAAVAQRQPRERRAL